MINTFASINGFSFYALKGKKVATMAFETLELKQTEELNEEDQWYLNYAVEGFVPGEVFTFKILVPRTGEKVPHTLVLGPARKFTHEVTLHAVGNPDHGQYGPLGPKKTVKIVGVDEASDVVMKYQQRYDMGGGNCAQDHGKVWELKNGKRRSVGRVAYNGRYQTNAEIKAFDKELKEKYGSLSKS